MSYIEALILGLIQGLTEFLPVSSSGHLELMKTVLGNESLPKESLTFTVILHFATALSTLVVFRKEVVEILKGLFQFKWNEETQFSFKIIASMLPAAFLGFFFEEKLASFFGGQLLLVGFMLIITALLGIDRTRAAKFSFLMVVPLIIGKVAKDILGGEISFESSEIGVFSVGFFAAFISGLFACSWMISLVKRSKLTYFAVYCAIVGSITIMFALMS